MFRAAKPKSKESRQQEGSMRETQQERHQRKMREEMRVYPNTSMER
jgi:hypothetical protein